MIKIVILFAIAGLSIFSIISYFSNHDTEGEKLYEFDKAEITKRSSLTEEDYYSIIVDDDSFDSSWTVSDQFDFYDCRGKSNFRKVYFIFDQNGECIDMLVVGTDYKTKETIRTSYKAMKYFNSEHINESVNKNIAVYRLWNMIYIVYEDETGVIIYGDETKYGQLALVLPHKVDGSLDIIEFKTLNN